MIRLKLNLPEAKVNYNEYGAMTSIPVAHAPNQIKNFGIPVEITGYVGDFEFFAFSLTSTARSFTVSEQLNLLRSLGFLTVPYVMTEATAGDSLIATRDKYSHYGASWIKIPSGEEYPIPRLITIKNTIWEMINHALTLQIVTDEGVFSRVDMRDIEYFQPGNMVKLFNGELLPYRTTPITNPIPTYCPKCNNPLKKVQIYSDLPLFYKCTSSFCEQMVLDAPDVDIPEVEEVEAEQQDTFRRQDTSSDSDIKVSEDSVLQEVLEADRAYKVINLEVDEELVQDLIFSGKVEFVEETEDADYVLTKTDRSVTKRSRILSKDRNIPLISVDRLEEKISE